jgi:hypothetical protein
MEKTGASVNGSGHWMALESGAFSRRRAFHEPFFGIGASVLERRLRTMS